MTQNNKEIEVLKGQDLTISKANVKQIISHFTIEEMNYLLSKIPPGRDGMLCQFLWRTGVRVTELISILKKDLDFPNNQMTIRWLKNRKYQFRVIPMHNSLKQPLYLFTAKTKYEDKVFPISRQRADQILKKYNLDHAHKIRHSFAINFLRQSNDPMALIILKELLGHSSIETTMRYLKVVPIDMKKAMEKINFDI